MDQTFDQPAARRLFARARQNLAEQIAADAAAIKAAAETGIRRRPQAAILRLLPQPDALETALVRVQDGAHRAWLRTATFSGGALALAILGLGVAVDVVTAVAFGAGLAALTATGLFALRRSALGRLKPDALIAVRAQIGEYLVVDHDGIHEYRLASDGAGVVDRHWPTDSVSGLSYGWTGLPGLIIATRHRKSRLGMFRMRDGADTRDLAIEEIDARFASIFGARYAGTTQAPRKAA